MKHFTMPRGMALIVASTLAGCGAPAGTTIGGAIPAHLHTQSVVSGPHRVLYVSDRNADAVYTFNPSNIAAGPTGKITSGIDHPAALAVDPSGILYVVNDPKNIELYKPGASTPFKTITSGFGAPRTVAIGADNTIAITFGGGILSSGTLVVWDKGSATPTRTIPISLLQQKGNTALVFAGLEIDASDNIFLSLIRYAHGPDAMLEFVPGSKRGIVTGRSPDANGGFDSAGNMYTDGLEGASGGFICVYAPSGKTCTRRVTNGLHSPGFFAVAADQTLFVPNRVHNVGGRPVNGNLVMYAPGASAPTVTFASSALTNPTGAALGLIP